MFDAKEKHEELLYEMLKAADAPGDDKERTDELNSMPDKASEPGSTGMDASWGEEPKESIHLSKQVLQGIREGREGLLGKLLDSKSTSDKAEQALVRQVISGPYETSSPQLSAASMAGSLSKRVQKAT